jgi:hypothetical protein
MPATRDEVQNMAVRLILTENGGADVTRSRDDSDARRAACMDLEATTLHELGDLSVVLLVAHDLYEAVPERAWYRGDDLPWSSQVDQHDYEKCHSVGAFAYIGIIMSVRRRGREIGSAEVWGVEHGQVGHCQVIDALAFQPPGKPRESRHLCEVVTGSGGSLAYELLRLALEDAADWLHPMHLSVSPATILADLAPVTT